MTDSINEDERYAQELYADAVKVATSPPRHVIGYVRSFTSSDFRRQRSEIQDYLDKIGLVADCWVFDQEEGETGLRDCVRDILQRCEEPSYPRHVVVTASPATLGMELSKLNYTHDELCKVADVHFAQCPDGQEGRAYFNAYTAVLYALEQFEKIDPGLANAVRRPLLHPRPPLPKIEQEAYEEGERGVYHRMNTGMREELGSAGPNEQKVRARVKAQESGFEVIE